MFIFLVSNVQISVENYSPKRKRSQRTDFTQNNSIHEIGTTVSINNTIHLHSNLMNSNQFWQHRRQETHWNVCPMIHTGIYIHIYMYIFDTSFSLTFIMSLFNARNDFLMVFSRILDNESCGRCTPSSSACSLVVLLCGEFILYSLRNGGVQQSHNQFSDAN